MRKGFLILFIFFCVALSGCKNPKTTIIKPSNDNLTKSMSFSIANLKTSIGKYEKKKNTEILSFSVQIKNLDSQDTTVLSITPLYKQELKENLADEARKTFPVNQLLRSGDTITIKGEVILSASKESSKANINWKPYIIGFKVLNEKIVR